MRCANSAWPSLCGKAQWVLAMISATAREETVSSGGNDGLCYVDCWHTDLQSYAGLIGSNNPRWLKEPQKGLSFPAVCAKSFSSSATLVSVLSFWLRGIELYVSVSVTATKTMSKDFFDHSDHELERSEIWNTVFVSGSMQSDGPDTNNKVSYSS